MSCISDKSPCYAELLFSVNLLSCSGLKPAHCKGELLFTLICGSMQSMLVVKSLISALQSEEQHMWFPGNVRSFQPQLCKDSLQQWGAQSIVLSEQINLFPGSFPLQRWQFGNEGAGFEYLVLWQDWSGCWDGNLGWGLISADTS